MNLFESIKENSVEILQEAPTLADKIDQLKRARDYITNNPDDPDNAEVEAKIKELEEEIKDMQTTENNIKSEEALGKLRSAIRNSTNLKDEKSYIADDIKSNNKDELLADIRWFNEDLDKIASDIIKDYPTCTTVIYSEVTKHRLDYNKFLAKLTKQEEPEEEPTPQRHSDEYCLTAAKEMAYDRLHDILGSDWRSKTDEDIHDAVISAVDDYNEANSLPEYKNTDFYNDEADPEEVFKIIKSEISKER